MEEQSKLAEEIKKLNNTLDELKTSGKHMIYSANPFKFAWFNFLSGIFHSLGSLFGYVVVLGLIIYLLSAINLTGLISKWVENTLGQVDWEKIMPKYEIPMPNGIKLDNFDIN